MKILSLGQNGAVGQLPLDGLLNANHEVTDLENASAMSGKKPRPAGVDDATVCRSVSLCVRLAVADRAGYRSPIPKLCVLFFLRKMSTGTIRSSDLETKAGRYSCPTTCMIWPISMALLDGIS
jgi:hypothetical protein